MAKRRTQRFRVGDWVSLLFGTRLVLAQVIEDRGPLGGGGRRLYRIRLDQPGGWYSTEFEAPEDTLEAATEPELAGWRTRGLVGIHQTISYEGKEKDRRGLPIPRFHYLVVARPGAEAGTGVASYFCLVTAPPMEVVERRPPPLIVHEGGPEAALRKAVEHLDAQHPGLKRVRGERVA